MKAFLMYADALARGAVPLEKRKHDDEALEPGPVDVVAALQAAECAERHADQEVFLEEIDGENGWQHVDEGDGGDE